jgi:hypothetical protein
LIDDSVLLYGGCGWIAVIAAVVITHIMASITISIISVLTTAALGGRVFVVIYSIAAA